MLPTCSLPLTTTGNSSNSNVSDPHWYPPQPCHNHMVLRGSLGSHDSFDLDHHVQHKPLKRRGLSKFYHSKSRSFSSLELACASVYGESARGLAKRQNSGELTMGMATLAVAGAQFQSASASDATAPLAGGGAAHGQAGHRSLLASRGSRQPEHALPSRRLPHSSRSSSQGRQGPSR
ncbi:hypothetical protein DUNSADRAFT_8458 [Dunaliella salina]|uniref:Encoded protein n=1 Tax=Dunaliella salina TaxID=3046 RepID=A0ABQ7GJI0_DUNSA|nr:hypothetical protein DUNSADRAFT_8458 [Dunaliella salina]|eukprot:KAF5834770.1 hypothetical protein DUNSADRAFT_8458 [Dunaliella salina]